MKKILLFVLLISSFHFYAQELGLQPYLSGFNSPVHITHAGDDRLFVVEQGGLIKVVQEDGSINSDPFLDISSQVSTGGERGLLGLTFHPNYSQTGYFYIYFTDPNGNSQLSRFTVDQDNPNIADPTSEIEMLTLDQPYSNHNGGCLAFGPDGYLYVGLGDGGSGGDPENRAQDASSLYGTILRLDIDGELPYAIPEDNPFVGDENQRDEIWAYGLRNPWKFSFDSQTGDLWIADVGQDVAEEINQVSAEESGVNYGWRCYEGNSAYDTTGCPDASELTFPVADYAHEAGRASVTGGYVYRGTEFPELQGHYIFADFVSNELGFLDDNNMPLFFGNLEAGSFSTFGVGNDETLYVASLSSGAIFKVTDTQSLTIDTAEKVSLKLFPNPSSGSLSVDVPTSLRQVSLSIFDLLGKTVYSENLTSGKTQLDISTLKKGVYIAQFNSDNETSKTQKLIVQ